MVVKSLTAKELAMTVVIGLVALMLLMGLCALVGTQEISLAKVMTGPGSTAGQNVDYEIFVGVRLPRVILAALVGAALASAGVALQAILRNPLADPYILGISSGAGLGIIVAILSGLTWSLLGGSALTVFAFLGASGAVWLVWFIGRFAGRSQMTSLLLAGVVVNAFLSAVIMFLTSIARSEQIRWTVFWLMGNITEKNWAVLAVSACCILAGIIVLCTVAQRLNALTFGQAEAQALGVDTARTQGIALAFAAFITAVAVSLSGLIGFVGLIVPHAARLVFGPDHRRLIPLGAIVGAAFLVVADTLARTVFGDEQLPVGVITAIAGGPFFLILLARYARKVSWLK